jgi:hypothetical protein
MQVSEVREYKTWTVVRGVRCRTKTGPTEAFAPKSLARVKMSTSWLAFVALLSQLMRAIHGTPARVKRVSARMAQQAGNYTPGGVCSSFAWLSENSTRGPILSPSPSGKAS